MFFKKFQKKSPEQVSQDFLKEIKNAKYKRVDKLDFIII